MSKSKGNIIKPREIIDQAGVDAIRLQFCTTDAGNFKPFSFNLMKESVLPFLTVLYNCHAYYKQSEKKKCGMQIEDRWILSKLNSLIRDVTKNLDKYSLHDAFQAILDFVVKDFSRTYIKMTRDREDTKEILGEILKQVSLLLAPFAPYISEYIYHEFEKESVHLSSWPKANLKKIDGKLETEFTHVFAIIEKGLAERDKEKIGLKWPLATAKISTPHPLDKKFQVVIKNQLNIKKLEIKKAKETSIKLDTKLTPELESEGYARELSRKVQSLRKKLGLQKKDKIELFIFVDEEFKKILEKQNNFIAERTNAKKLEIVTTGKERFKNNISFRIKDKKGDIALII